MASKIEAVAPTIREVEIEGYPCIVTIDVTGIHIRRKGDKRKEKTQIDVSWSDLLEIGGDKMGVAAYQHLGF